MWSKGLAALGIGAIATATAAEVRFAPIDLAQHVYDGGWEHYVGGGVAVFDCDGDGLSDLVVAGGENPAVLMRNRSHMGGDIRFEAATPADVELTGVAGVYALDIDGDGWRDLVILRVGENKLLKGGPECSFRPMEIDGFDGGDGWTTAFSATWEAGNALPTLAFGNYVDRTNPDGPFEACDANVLFRPDGDGYAKTLLEPGFCPLSMLFSDWGRQGRADLRVSNDRHYYVKGGAEQMWAMEDVPRLLEEADGWATHMLWGMGIASRDLDFDGMSEVFLSSMGDQRLMRLTGATGPTFEDVPYEMGTSAHRPYQGGDGRPSTGWHIAFGDVDNDGLDDVFIAKGNVEQMPDAAMEDPNNLLIQMPDGSFEEQGGVAGIGTMARSRGAALADLNNNGLLDLVVVNRRAPMEVYQNVTENAGHWVAMTLLGDGGNGDAVGAFIEVQAGARTYVRELVVGGGHAGGVAVPEHFGLGDVTDVKVRVIWPGGIVSDWVDLKTGAVWMLWADDDGLAVAKY
ncbi:CRTAC1 family protein [Shimia sp. Alg240-R146]|uniref:CRTAC1 family protein n=1 Tax=Shimia sp. Alg240-R146 TaxID=2993449 RepID=UPI0022E7899B|nr:CRTAC1 family protein [Shimia sp. Alg240-R146]